MCKMMSMNLVEAYGVASDDLQLQSKTKNGNFFVTNEEQQLCSSCLTRPMIRNGQKFAMF